MIINNTTTLKEHETLEVPSAQLPFHLIPGQACFFSFTSPTRALNLSPHKHHINLVDVVNLRPEPITAGLRGNLKGPPACGLVPWRSHVLVPARPATITKRKGRSG